MGIHAEIYRGGYDCEINRFYGKRMVTVVNAPGPFDPSDDAPAVIIVRGNAPGTLMAVAAAENPDNDPGAWVPLRPVFEDADGPRALVAPMMGGTYIAASDGRFGETCERVLGARFYGAVALHDRFETPEQYRAMSSD